MTERKPVKNWRGADVVGVELADKVVRAWEVTPAKTNEFDSNVVRSWGSALDLVRDVAECRLEDMSDDEIKGGLIIKIQLIGVAVGDLEDFDCEIERRSVPEDDNG